MQRVDPVSLEELFKELEMLKLQKNRLREDMMVTACKYVGKELNLLFTLKIWTADPYLVLSISVPKQRLEASLADALG